MTRLSVTLLQFAATYCAIDVVGTYDTHTSTWLGMYSLVLFCFIFLGNNASLASHRDGCAFIR